MNKFPIDKNLTDKFVKIQKVLKPSIIVEVGSFDAEFSHIAVEKNLSEKVYAFEASPYVYENFKDKINKKIIFQNLAISNIDGYLKFEIQKDLKPGVTRNNSILNRNENKKYEYVDVKCAKLDTLFLKEKNICMWIDVEGANREVLLGATECLRETISIFIETEHKDFWKDQWQHNDVVNFLNSQGFTMIDTSFQGPLQSNSIFIKTSLFLKNHTRPFTIYQSDI